MGNVQTTGRQEIDYVYADILPIVFSLLAGIIAIGIICFAYCCKCCCCCKSKCCKKCCMRYCPCTKIGNYLIQLLYGGQFTSGIVTLYSKQRKRGLYIDNIRVGERLTSLKCMLVTNAASLLTLGGTIFWDLYMVRSDFGCIVDEDCYPSNEDYHEHPLGDNCTLYADSGITTICYRFNLSLLDSLGGTGGILLIATGLTAILTKILIECQNCCHFELLTGQQPKTVKTCAITTCKIICGMVLLAAIITAIVYIHMSTLSGITMFRSAGYAFQYSSVLFSLFLTIFTPWITLIRSQPLGPIYLTLEREDGQRKYNQRPIGPMYIVPINNANDGRREYQLRYEGDDDPPQNPIYLTSFYNETSDIPPKHLEALNKEYNWADLPENVRLYSIDFQGNNYPANDTFYLRNDHYNDLSGPIMSKETIFIPENNAKKWVGPVHINCQKLGPIYLTLERQNGRTVPRERQPIGPMYLVPTEDCHLPNQRRPVYTLHYEGNNDESPQNPVYLTTFYYKKKKLACFPIPKRPKDQSAILNDNNRWTTGNKPLPDNVNMYSIQFSGENCPKRGYFYIKNVIYGTNTLHGPFTSNINSDKLWEGPIQYYPLGPIELTQPPGPIELTLERIGRERATDEQRQPIGPFYLKEPIEKEDGTIVFQLCYQGNEQLNNPMNLTSFFYADEKPDIFEQEAKWGNVNLQENEHLFSVHFQGNLPQEQTEFKLRDADTNDINEDTEKAIKRFTSNETANTTEFITIISIKTE